MPGRPALEAMACSVPVLAPNIGGLPEVARHRETGYLFPAGDQTAAAIWAESLLADPERHQTMRTAAARRALRFSANQVVPKYERLYHDLLKY